MDILSTVVFQNTLEKWIAALSVGTLSYLLLTLFRRKMVKRLRVSAEKNSALWDDAFLVVLFQARHFFLFLISVYASIQLLTLPPKISGAVGKLTFLALLLQLIFWGTALIRYFIERDTKTKQGQDGARAQTMRAVGFLSTLILYIVILLWGLDNFGVNITTLVAGLGVGGIAIALAVQNILGDLFASLTIVLDKPFVYGDFITVGEYKGTVEKVGLKTTRIRSISGEQLIFPNANLLQSRIRNFKRMQERRSAFVFNIDNGTPVECLREFPEALKKIVEKTPKARFERACFTQITPTNALEFEVVFWVLSPDYQVFAQTQQAINIEIVALMQEKKIRFPFAPAPSPLAGTVQLQPPAGK